MTLHILIRPLDFRTMARYFFLALGIGCLGIYSGVFFHRELYQAYESRQFDRTPRPDWADGSPLQGTIEPSVTASARARKSARQSQALPASAIIGRLSVQRLHLTAMVREGVDDQTLQLAVGHIPSTPLPGQA